MNVSGKAIFEKIEAEILKAKREYDDRELCLRRIANIKLLCELMLDESTIDVKTSASTRPTLEEIEQMTKRPTSIKSDERVKHDPESIFDF